MKITFDWLKDHLKTNLKENNLLEQLTNIGLEVESVENLSADNDLFKIAKVIKVEKQTQRISRFQWHCLCNETDKELSIIEIQFGDDCRESDIIRKQLPRGDYLFSD